MCKFGVVPCPNGQYGCKAELVRSNINVHLKSECQFNPVTCKWCGKHTVNEDVSKIGLFDLFSYYSFVSGIVLKGSEPDRTVTVLGSLIVYLGLT